MKLFNINQYIYIRLTDEGTEYVNSLDNRNYANLILKSYVMINNIKWYRLQCWTVFELFPVGNGKMYFETTIMFDNEDLIEVNNGK